MLPTFCELCDMAITKPTWLGEHIVCVDCSNLTPWADSWLTADDRRAWK